MNREAPSDGPESIFSSKSSDNNKSNIKAQQSLLEENEWKMKRKINTSDDGEVDGEEESKIIAQIAE